MSESDALSQVLVEPGSAEIHGSPGKLLREAREAAGVHIAALAGALKIPVSKLEALENDNFSELPDAVFARALASSICRTLNVDAEVVLKLMPKNELLNFSPTTSGINTSFKNSSRKIGKNSFLQHAIRPVSVAVLILLIGVLVILFVPFGKESPAIVNQDANFDLHASEPEAIGAPTLPALVVPDMSRASEPARDDVAAPSAIAPISADLTTTSPDAVAHNIPAGLLEFRSLGESWVQVRDATKAVVFERTLQKGDIASASGELPLTVVVGRADVTEVFVRGKIFELANVAKENVARFEVKQ